MTGQDDRRELLELAQPALRCSVSEGGGTAQFASALIGKREIIRQTVSTNTEAHRVLSDIVRGYSSEEQQH